MNYIELGDLMESKEEYNLCKHSIYLHIILE